MRTDRIAAASLLCLILGATLTFAAINPGEPTPATTPPAGVVIRRTPPPPIASMFKKVPIRPLPSIISDDGRLRYRGTTIAPNRKATGNEMALQKVVVSKLSQLDFIPNTRVAHFRWLENYPVKITNWRGEIEGTKRTPEGVLVRVKVWPDVVPIRGKLMAHMDRFYEIYLYSKGVLTLVGWEDPGPNSFFIPL